MDRGACRATVHWGRKETDSTVGTLHLAYFPRLEPSARATQLGRRGGYGVKVDPGVSESESRSVVSNSLRPHRLYSPWNSPGQNTEVGCCSLLQGIFPTQGSNPGLLHCRWILYQLSHQGSPRILEWLAYPFSSRSS